MSDKKSKKKSEVNVAQALAYQFPESKFTYDEPKVILYNLSIGAAKDALDAQQLNFAYENASEFQVIPTFGVTIPWNALSLLMSVPGLPFNPMMLLHGEQYMELKKPLAPSGTLTNRAKIAGIYDKGKAALVILQVRSYDEQNQEVLFNEYSLFIRGIGGFGGDKQPKPENTDPPADAKPSAVISDATMPNQALWYRLTGDVNPLHADPDMAGMAGFKKPILHGLCSLGFAGRAVLKAYCNNDTKRFKSIRVRFASPVYPGETIITETWRVSPTRILFRCKVAERDIIVLNGGCVDLHPEMKAKL